jgi:hypothetical protein
VPHETVIELEIAEYVLIRFSRSGRPVERYAVVLLLFHDGRWQEIRLFDNHLGKHHTHRYTRTDGKQAPELFHPGPINEAMPTAIEHLRTHWEAIIESWLRT